MRTTTGKFRWGVAAIGAALFLAACSSANATTSPTGGAKSSAPMIGTGNAAGVGTVLTDARGMTLYHLTTESGGKIQCTGSCAQTWPPVPASGSLPAATGALTGTFGTVKRPDGSMQLTYNGMPLYTYSGDSAPGQANGQGIQGVWFAVTPSGSNSTATGSSGGYGKGGGSSSSSSSSGSGW